MMPYLAAVLAGLLLAASNPPLQWWPLQFVGFVPFWWALLRQRTARRWLWPIGVLFAVAFVGPLLLVLGLDAPFLVLLAANLVQWPVVAMACGRLVARGPVRGPLAAAAALALVEIATWWLVPMFGTAQSFVRPLASAPAAIAFVAFTGLGGLVVASSFVQALLASAAVSRTRAPLLAAAATIVVCASLSLVRWTRPLGESVRVAALGSQGWIGELAPWFERAKTAGARLLVTPECGVAFGDREFGMRHLGELAARHGIAAAIGVDCRDNLLWLVDATGELVGEYHKTHLVPFLEPGRCGDGTIATAHVAGVLLGGMICQDDNFTDLARANGRRGAQLVAVPTNDWPAIRRFHLESSVLRTIENGYAVVRAASNGVSALISPRGEILAEHDHVGDDVNARLLLGDLPVGDGAPTLYARFGDAPLLLASLVVLWLLLRRPQRATPAAPTVG